jgi:hypothetical protein
MKWIFVCALFLAVCALLAQPAWGQSALPQSSQSKLSERKLNHVVTTSTGHKAQLRLSQDAERIFRAQHPEISSNGKSIGASGSDPTCPTGNALIYHGGPVMRSPTNYVIMWQSPFFSENGDVFPDSLYQTGIELFFQSLGGTPFYNIVTQYGDSPTSGDPFGGLPVPNASFWGGSWVDTSNVPASLNDGSLTSITCTSGLNCPLTDGDIQQEVTNAIAANPTWLPPGNNVEYFVFLPPKVGECSDATDCYVIPGEPNGDFCAYHSYFNGHTIYAVMPYGAYGGRCHGTYDSGGNLNINNYPNREDIDIEVSLASHESIEANADPLPDSGWLGDTSSSGCGGKDEMADKCAYYEGYVAPDGTNVVLNGNRFQIQMEFSNELVPGCTPLVPGGTPPVACACTKRYGPSPVTETPGPVNFGVVQAGTTAQRSVQIQNNGEGPLNILNIRVDDPACPDCYYSLLNGQPTAATLLLGEGETANVQFAPYAPPVPESPTAKLEVDTDQTPYNGGNNNTTAFANITGTVGVPPDAVCKAASVSTDPGVCYAKTASTTSINNGSSNPDGDPYSLLQSPAGPYPLGSTLATLTITDDGPLGYGSASCQANVTVNDTQKPTITCPAAQTVLCTSSSGATVKLYPKFSDNCPGVTASCVPASGSTFGFGTTNPVTCTATDTSSNTQHCTTSVTVKDVPPVISSVVASPAKLKKALTPVTVLVKDSDICDPSPVCSITKVTANHAVPANYIKITGPLTLNLMNPGELIPGLKYTITVTCKDHHGGSTSANTTVESETE